VDYTLERLPKTSLAYRLVYIQLELNILCIRLRPDIE